METIEYKQLSVDFNKGLRDLVSDIEDVGDGEITDDEQRRNIIAEAKGKLYEYKKLLSTLEAHFAKDLKNDSDEDMEYIEEILKGITE